MSEKLIFNCTHGKEDPERATLPFVAANVAATAGQEAVVLCTIDAVWLGTTGGADSIAQPGLPVLDDLYQEFVDNGGQVWLCGACTKPRDIDEEQVRKGSIIVGAAKVVEEVVAGAKTVAFAQRRKTVAGIAVDVAKLRDEIRAKYVEVVEHPDATFHFHTGLRAAANAGYLDGWLEGLPKSSIASFAGVANPFHWGLPRPGERVVDVGSGTGMDAMVAANAVGAEGRVVGVDMTPEMLERAREGAGEAEILNVEFREGLAEQLPVDTGWADLVISNGVINLVPDKLGAYREVARVLKPGGRAQIADICVVKPVPESALKDIDLWTG